MKEPVQEAPRKRHSKSDAIEADTKSGTGSAIGNSDQSQQENRRQTRSCTRKKSLTAAAQQTTVAAGKKYAEDDINGNRVSSKSDKVEVQFEEDERQLRRGRKRKWRTATDTSCKRSRNEIQPETEMDEETSPRQTPTDPLTFKELMTTIYVENIDLTISQIQDEENLKRAKLEMLEKCFG